MSDESGAIDGAAIPVRSQELVWADLDGEIVLYQPERGVVVVLNATASAVWASLDGGTSLEWTAVSLAERYGEEIDLVREQVFEVVRGFESNGLLAEVRKGVKGDDDHAADAPG